MGNTLMSMTIPATTNFELSPEEIDDILKSSSPPPWAPLFKTQPVSSRTRGDDIIDFMETFMTIPTDEKAGDSLVLPEWQKELLRDMFEEDEDGYLRFQTFLWGVARKNGKSMILTGIGLYFLTFGGPGHQIIAAASSANQAGIIFDVAKKQVLDSPYLSKIVKPYKNTLVNRMNGSVFKTVAADADSVQGLGGSIILCDEIHAWEKITSIKHSLNFWGALSTSRNNRKESIMIGITTAGENLYNTLVGNLYNRGVKSSSLEPSYENRFGFAWWACPEDFNPLDENNWPLANPNLYFGHINLKMLRGDLQEQMDNNNTGYFFRMALNMWVKIEGESFVSSYHWEQAAKPEMKIQLGEKVTGGFDGGLSADSTVLVIQSMESGHFEIFREWANDGTEGWTVTREQVEAALEEMMNNYQVQEIWFDRSYWDREISDWQMKWKDKITIIPQTRQRITPLATQFNRDIAEQRISHPDDKVLNAYVMAAVMTEDGGYAKAKVKGKVNRIDGLVASVLSNGCRNYHQILAEKRKNVQPAQMQVF